MVKLTHEDIENFKELGEGFSRENFTEGWKHDFGTEFKKEYLEK